MHLTVQLNLPGFIARLMSKPVSPSNNASPCVFRSVGVRSLVMLSLGIAKGDWAKVGVKVNGNTINAEKNSVFFRQQNHM